MPFFLYKIWKLFAEVWRDNEIFDGSAIWAELIYHHSTCLHSLSWLWVQKSKCVEKVRNNLLLCLWFRLWWNSKIFLWWILATRKKSCLQVIAGSVWFCLPVCSLTKMHWACPMTKTLKIASNFCRQCTMQATKTRSTEKYLPTHLFKCNIWLF